MRKELTKKELASQQFALKIEEVLQLLCTNLTNARDSIEHSVNHNQQPALVYRVGDLVLLSTKNINSARPIPKFDAKYIGPFPIAQIVSSHSY